MSAQSDPNTSLRRVWYFPVVGAAVICVGLYLHVTRLFLEPEVMATQIYTPNFDLAFFIPMLFTAICMPIFWRHVKSTARWRNVFYWVVVVYFWISVPFHLRVQINQSNDIVFTFPEWYSVVMLPWLALQLYFFRTITVTASAPEPRTHAPAQEVHS